MPPESSLKDQALEAAKALDAQPAEDSSLSEDNSVAEDTQDGSESKSTEDNKPEVDEEEAKPVEKEEPKPSVFEVDGEQITHDDVRKWREDSVNKEKWQTDLTQKSQEVSSVKQTLDQIKDIFVKENKSEELTPEEEDFRTQADTLFKDPYVQNLIQSEINKGMELRTQEETTKKAEEDKKKFQENLTTEVKNLEKELDGSDGRPKYVDSEILDWQKDNKKLYLPPKEAYESKFRNELVEWEVQKRLKNKGGEAPKSAQTAAASDKKIEGEKDTLPSDRFIRGKAMLDHLQNLEKGE